GFLVLPFGPLPVQLIEFGTVPARLGRPLAAELASDDTVFCFCLLVSCLVLLIFRSADDFPAIQLFVAAVLTSGLLHAQPCIIPLLAILLPSSHILLTGGRRLAGI